MVQSNGWDAFSFPFLLVAAAAGHHWRAHRTRTPISCQWQPGPTHCRRSLRHPRGREGEVLQLVLPPYDVVGLEEERMWRRLETSSTQTSTTGVILAAITDAMVVGEEAVREWTAKIHQGQRRLLYTLG